MRGRAIGVVLPTLVVLALVAVVAIAATGSTPGGSDATRTPSDPLLDAFFTIGIVAVVAGGLLLLYGLAQRKAIAREVATGRYRRTAFLGWIAFAAVFTLLSYGRLKNWTPQPPEQVDEESVFGGSTVPTTPGGRKTVAYEPDISWLSIAVVLTLVLGAVVAFVVAERRSRTGSHGREAIARQLADALDDALDDLRAETDARRAIIAAYARLERVLAASGIPRRPAETSDEYLARVLGSLTPGSDAIARLTLLFTQAKFSHHDVHATMKEEAIDALEQARDALRARADQGPRPAEVEPTIVQASS